MDVLVRSTADLAGCQVGVHAPGRGLSLRADGDAADTTPGTAPARADVRALDPLATEPPRRRHPLRARRAVRDRFGPQGRGPVAPPPQHHAGAADPGRSRPRLRGRLPGRPVSAAPRAHAETAAGQRRPLLTVHGGPQLPPRDDRPPADIPGLQAHRPGVPSATCSAVSTVYGRSRSRAVSMLNDVTASHCSPWPGLLPSLLGGSPSPWPAMRRSGDRGPEPCPEGP